MTPERWHTFSDRLQLLTIGAEFERARVAEEEGDTERIQMALDRALTLIDLTLEDKKWSGRRAMLEGLQSDTTGFRTGETKGTVAVLWRAL